jgi:hypothetical protein
MKTLYHVYKLDDSNRVCLNAATNTLRAAKEIAKSISGEKVWIAKFVQVKTYSVKG